MNIFPLDFGEFLTALNVQPQLLSTLRKHYEARKPVDSIVHEKLIEIFYLYLVIGGMPAAVQSFVDTGDFMDVVAIHKKIIEQYKVDFTRYEQESLSGHIISFPLSLTPKTNALFSPISIRI